MKRDELISMVYRLVRQSNGELGIEAIDRLISIARALSRLDTKDCSEGLSPQAERRRDALVLKAKVLAGGVGAIAYHQSDPRGASLYIVFPEDLRGQDIRTSYSCGVALY